jgi:hypothetical protein
MYEYLTSYFTKRTGSLKVILLSLVTQKLQADEAVTIIHFDS